MADSKKKASPNKKALKKGEMKKTKGGASWMPDPAKLPNGIPTPFPNFGR